MQCLKAITLLVFLVLGDRTSAIDQHLVCKSVDEIFTSNSDGDLTLPSRRRGAVIQGRPGKIGPIGQKGEVGQKGEKGDDGSVDYNEINETLTRMFSNERMNTNERLREETSTIATLRRDVIRIRGEMDSQSVSMTTMRRELAKLNQAFVHYSRHPVRLAGTGSTSSQGRVEIFMYGSWGTVCDDGWDINDGNVVCKQLGFARASRVVTQASDFGQGSGNTWLDNVACTGEESHISHCRYVMNEDCGHSEDAGVYCE